MMLAATVLLTQLLAVTAAHPQTLADAIAAEKNREVRYLNSWALEVSNGSDATADALARKHGLINRGQVSAKRHCICTCVSASVRHGFRCEFLFQIGNLRNHYLFMDGNEAREVTKELSDLMQEKTAALKAEEAVRRHWCTAATLWGHNNYCCSCAGCKQLYTCTTHVCAGGVH